MGIALFTMANTTVADVSGRDLYDRQAEELLDWLVDHRIRGYAGFCGGHRHDIQTLDGVVPVGTPGIVGTSYAVKALLRGDRRYDDEYAEVYGCWPRQFLLSEVPVPHQAGRPDALVPSLDGVCSR